MGLFMYQMRAGGSNQAYLGSVRLCPMCNGQKPKDTFRVVDGESICEECQIELKIEQQESE
jgi:hypothetical protein